MRLACAKADRARALGQVSTGAIPSAILRLLQLRRLIYRMFWRAAGLTTNIGGPAFTPSYSYALEDVTTVAAVVQAGAGSK